MNKYEHLVLILILFLISVLKEFLKGENLSKIIKSVEDLEIIFFGIILYSFYNSLKCCFFCEYFKDNNCKDEDDYNSYKYKTSPLCCICRLTDYLFNSILNFISELLSIFNYLICCCNCCNCCNLSWWKVCFDSFIFLNYFGRIILTKLSLEALFFFYNIIIQSVLIFPGLLIDMKKNFYYHLFKILYPFFVEFSLNVLIIPTYEFITLPYLNYDNPNYHINSFKYISNGKIDEEKLEKENSENVKIYLTVFGIYYLLFFIISIFDNDISFFKDFFLKAPALIYIIYHYMSIIWCYLFYSIYFLIKTCRYDKYNEKCYIYDLNSYYDKNNLNFPEINLINFIFSDLKQNKIHDVELENPFDNKQKKYFKNNCRNRLIIIINIIIIIFSLFALIYLFINFPGKINPFSKFIFILVYLVIIILSFWITFPLKYFKTLKEQSSIKNKIQITISIIFSLFIKFLIFLLYFKVLSKTDIDDQDRSKFNTIKLNSSEIGANFKNFHSFCDSKVFNIPIYLYLPFINDAYYYNYNDNFTSFNNNNYTKLFFGNKYKINTIKNLTNENNRKIVKMIQYNIQNIDNKNNVTILSTQGTSNKRDFLLDAQLYLPSLLLTVINSFSSLNKEKEQHSWSLIEYGLSIPYRLFFQFFMIEEYLTELENVYNKNNETFCDNIIIVGHSLGGGLAKIFGKKIGKKAISLSGPGINAFNSLWNYKGNISEFGLTSIDIIPDLDPVPRVELSGGTSYRILCKKSPLECHNKELSLCESLIICRIPYAREYCRNIAKVENDYIDDIYNSTKFD